MMRKYLMITLVISLLFSIIGCSSLNRALNPKPDLALIDNFKKVGVMSLTADQLTRDYIGVTAFGNEYEKIDISSWKIDDEYESQIQTALVKLGIFNVSKLSYDRKEFYPVFPINVPIGAGLAYRAPIWNNIEPKLKLLAEKYSLDAIIIVIRDDNTEDVVEGRIMGGMSFRFVQGIGLFNGRGSSLLFMLCRVAIIDGRTGKPVFNRSYVRTQKVEPEKSRAKFEDLNEYKIAELRTRFLRLAEDNWAPIFQQLFLSER